MLSAATLAVSPLETDLSVSATVPTGTGSLSMQPICGMLISSISSSQEEQHAAVSLARPTEARLAAALR